VNEAPKIIWGAAPEDLDDFVKQVGSMVRRVFKLEEYEKVRTTVILWDHEMSTLESTFTFEHGFNMSQARKLQTQARNLTLKAYNFERHEHEVLRFILPDGNMHFSSIATGSWIRASLGFKVKKAEEIKEE
jgi:hypothetical protein